MYRGGQLFPNQNSILSVVLAGKLLIRPFWSQRLKLAMETAAQNNNSLIILHNALIVTMDAQSRVFLNGGVAIQSDTIIAIGQSADILQKFSSLSAQVIDLHGQFLLPGSICLPVVLL